MLVIFEGIDRVGKDTQIKLFQKYMFNNYNKLFHQLHCSGFANNTLSKAVLKQINLEYYNEMFQLLCNPYNFILNRSHLGEYVYGPMYREYDGSYVLELEKKLPKDCYLILLLDSVDNVLKREDNDSFTCDRDKKQHEIDLFKEIFNKTSIKNKILIELNNRNINDIHEEIIKFVKENSDGLFFM